MGHQHSLHLEPADYRLDALGEAPRRFGRTAGIVGLIISIVGFALGMTGGHPEQFAMSWLIGSIFVATVGLGGLFFVMLQHLSKAGWSAVVRRVAEIVMMTLPFAAILIAPVVLFTAAAHWGGVFPWADRWIAEHDFMTMKKIGYLSPGFFVVRIVLYFALWNWLATTFYRKSVEQDTSGDVEITRKLQWLAAPGMILFALSISFFAFDILMSMDPHWFSTIFGIYIFGGAHLSLLCVMAIAVTRLMKHERYAKLITPEHLHDIGKLMFAFVFFWGYVAFSQYMIYWYGNIPEEHLWFRLRSQGTWGILFVVLLVGHLLVPFAGLLSRHVKRDPKRLAFWACFLLVMHAVDLYWLARPNLDSHLAHVVATVAEAGGSHGADAAHAGHEAHAAPAAGDHGAMAAGDASHGEAHGHHLPAFTLVDLLALLGPVLLGIWYGMRVARNSSLIALRDPRLEESVGLVNI